MFVQANKTKKKIVGEAQRCSINNNKIIWNSKYLLLYEYCYLQTKTFMEMTSYGSFFLYRKCCFVYQQNAQKYYNKNEKIKLNEVNVTNADLGWYYRPPSTGKGMRT